MNKFLKLLYHLNLERKVIKIVNNLFNLNDE